MQRNASRSRGVQAGAEEYKLEHGSTSWSTGAQAHRNRVEQELYTVAHWSEAESVVAADAQELQSRVEQELHTSAVSSSDSRCLSADVG